MTDTAKYHDQFTAEKTAVLVPTYNNAKTLESVIRDILSYTSHIIVVNDGSTDETSAILDTFPQIQRVEYTANRGKGIALRRGFRYAVDQGYDYVITIDADGQHFASDLPVMLEKLETERNAIIIGARNLQQENMPGKNTFANKFSNFWFYVETGLKGPDTQSGYRLYPVYAMRNMRFWCTKYEFEIEVLVRSAWKGIKIDWAPIKVYYPPAEERVSHFRPFRDFSRISVLNTVLVTIAFLYIKPRDFIRYLLKAESWRSMWYDHVLNKEESNFRKALSIGFGVFMGIVPIWGFQMVTAMGLAVLFRLNKALVFMSCHVSLPPMIPFVVFASFATGTIWVKEGSMLLPFSTDLSLDVIKQNLFQYLTGACTLAIAAGVLVTLTVYVLLAIFRNDPARQKQGR
jgi:glycosyltransferase involved in cell wall biosynthesis